MCINLLIGNFVNRCHQNSVGSVWHCDTIVKRSYVCRGAHFFHVTVPKLTNSKCIAHMKIISQAKQRDTLQHLELNLKQLFRHSFNMFDYFEEHMLLGWCNTIFCAAFSCCCQMILPLLHELLIIMDICFLGKYTGKYRQCRLNLSYWKTKTLSRIIVTGCGCMLLPTGHKPIKR